MSSNWSEFWDSLPPGTHYAIYVIAGLAAAGLVAYSPLAQRMICAILEAIATATWALLAAIFQVLKELWRRLTK